MSSMTDSLDGIFFCCTMGLQRRKKNGGLYYTTIFTTHKITVQFNYGTHLNFGIELLKTFELPPNNEKG